MLERPVEEVAPFLALLERAYLAALARVIGAVLRVALGP